MKILVVEDDAVSMKLLSTILEKYAYEVITAVTGRDAISQLEKNLSIDIIMTDIMMPVMDGFHLLSYLRADVNHRRIPVILCSTRNDLVSVKRGIELGAMDYVVKPIEPDLLLSKLKRAEARVPGAALIVNHEELVCDILGRSLTREGIRVIMASTGARALEIIKENKICVVLTAIEMPEMNGMDLLIEIKENYPSIHVFLITGHDGQYGKEDVMSAGADGFITKPFTSAEISRRVRPFIK